MATARKGLAAARDAKAREKNQEWRFFEQAIREREWVNKHRTVLEGELAGAPVLK